MPDIHKNTPELWDNVWRTLPLSEQKDRYDFAKEEHSVRWRRIERRVLEAYGSFQDLRVIEIGAGAGTYAALMAKRGAAITILDYSDLALERGREFFARHQLAAEFLNQDALRLTPELLNCYDVSMSFGLVEHFQGADRLQIVRSHRDVLKPGGQLFISVPNQICPPYRLFKFAAQQTGKWIFGEEYPASRGELLNIARQLSLEDAAVLGGSLGASFDFINPFKALAVVRRLFRLRDDYDTSRLRNEIGTPMDSFLSYALVLYGKKPSVPAAGQ